MASGLCRDCRRFRTGRHQPGWGECEAPEVKRALYHSPVCPLAVRADFGCRYFAAGATRPAPPREEAHG